MTGRVCWSYLFFLWPPCSKHHTPHTTTSRSKPQTSQGAIVIVPSRPGSLFCLPHYHVMYIHVSSTQTRDSGGCCTVAQPLNPLSRAARAWDKGLVNAGGMVGAVTEGLTRNSRILWLCPRGQRFPRKSSGTCMSLCKQRLSMSESPLTTCAPCIWYCALLSRRYVSSL